MNVLDWPRERKCDEIPFHFFQYGSIYLTATIIVDIIPIDIDSMGMIITSTNAIIFIMPSVAAVKMIANYWFIIVKISKFPCACIYFQSNRP